MSNETDLDWLARNVHAWPENGIIEIATTEIPSKLAFDGVAFSLQQSAPISRHAKYVTKQQWLTRRAELQNKPSWNDAPEWAEWLAQDKHGDWWWHKETPKTRISEFDSVGAKESNTGEVLGDWRDTLEKRPEEFQPLTSIEDNQEQDMAQQQDMKQDNGWFERGELPPVGALCEYTLGANAPWYKCEIKYVVRGAGVVMKRIPCGTEQYCSLYSKQPVSFRPIRTERDVLLSVIIEEMNHYDTDGKLADAILAAGFSLGAK